MKSLRIPGLAILFLWTVAAQAADPARSAPKATPIQPTRTGAEIVGNLLTPGPSDPDVPLPSPALKDDVGGGRSPTGPRIYGREETGGAVFGLRFPIPVPGGAAKADTRYSFDPMGREKGLEAR